MVISSRGLRGADSLSLSVSSAFISNRFLHFSASLATLLYQFQQMANVKIGCCFSGGCLWLIFIIEGYLVLQTSWCPAAKLRTFSSWANKQL
jgi:hypothetical protein